MVVVDWVMLIETGRAGRSYGKWNLRKMEQEGNKIWTFNNNNNNNNNNDDDDDDDDDNDGKIASPLDSCSIYYSNIRMT